MAADVTPTDPSGGPGAHRAFVALDVGGTDIKAFCAGDDGTVLAERVSPTRAAEGPDAALAAVLGVAAAMVASVPPTHRAVSVGVVVPGTVDEAAGVVEYAENIGWRDLPLRDLVARETGLPTGFGHDVRSGGLAEWRLGAGRGADDLAYLSIGTGIAVALVLDGRPYAGRGWAGELGHGDFRDGTACPCGGRGCLETFASAAGIARAYRARTGASAREVAGSAEVLARSRSGDEVAAAVWQEAVDGLGRLVAQLVRTLAVPTVVVGGGLVRAGRELLDPLREATSSWLTFHPVPRLVPAALGSSAGTHGALLLARDAHEAASR